LAQPFYLGDTVNYAPRTAEVATRAAVIIETHSDGTVDLRIFGGYCQSTTDMQNVPQSDWGDPGTFFYPKGSKGGDVLKTPMTATDTTVNLNNGTGDAAVNDWLEIEQEYMVVTAVVNLKTLTVTRGQGGSTAVPHAAGRLIKIGVVAPS
jgi:hypothetical protein